MKIRVANVALALALPLALLACEEKGIPAPAADTAQTKQQKPADSSEAKPTDVAKADGSAAPEDKQAKNDDGDEDADKDADDKDTGDKDADDKDADDKNADGDTKAGTATKAADKKPEKKEDEPEPTKGEKKVEGSYAAWLQTSGKYKVDQPGAVVAVVNAQGEYKCNDKYPYKFKVGSAPAGVTFGSTTVRGASIGKKSTSLRIPFTPTSKGAKTISGTFYFSVCNEETCQIKKQPMSVSINVE